MKMTQAASCSKLFSKANIRLSLVSEGRDDAIRRAGGLLQTLGYVSSEYIDSMIERERSISTFMGKGLAIPHGVGEARKYIVKSGIVLLQYPDGIEFEGGAVRLLLGLAVSDDEHLGLLSNIANLFIGISDEALEKLCHSQDLDYVYDVLSGI